jgi:hypothetical protein
MNRCQELMSTLQSFESCVESEELNSCLQNIVRQTNDAIEAVEQELHKNEAEAIRMADLRSSVAVLGKQLPEVCCPSNGSGGGVRLHRPPCVAKVNDDSDWILLSVLSRDEQADRICVQDDDNAQIYTLKTSQVLLLPENTQPFPLYMPEDRVLGLFPGTTTFYPASIVKKVVARTQKKCTLRFDGDTLDGNGATICRSVAREHVLKLPTPT